MKVTLWREDVAILRPVAAVAQRHDNRVRLFVRLEHDDEWGFGEVAPQTRALNGDPSVDEVIDELESVVLPQLREVVKREGSPPSWTRVARFAGSRPSSPVAVSLVEMAVLDRELRATHREARALWPKRFSTPVQSTVSLLDLDQPWVIGDDVARVRVKTAPGPLASGALDRLAALTVPIVLDFNCSANDAGDVLEQVAQIGPAATIAAVEQPFAPGNVVDHAVLGQRLQVPLSLDEGVRSLRDLEQIVRYRAARIVCIKPARVGGLANARTLVAKATELHLVPYFGGFFESPFARGVHRLLAEHCVGEPSDLAVVELAGPLSGHEVADAPGGFGIAPAPGMLEGATVIAAGG